MPVYSSSDKVAAYLQISAFDGNSTPTVSTVNDFINRAERTLESATNRAFGGKVIKNTDYDTRDYEYHDTGPPWSVYEFYSIVHKARIYLKHPNIVTPLVAAQGDSLGVWSGTSWVEWVGVKTEDRNGDFWINADESIIYFQKGLPIWRYPDGIRVRYRYSGPAGVDVWVEDCVTKLAAISIMEHWKQFAYTTPELAKADINTVIRNLREETDKMMKANRWDANDKRLMVIG